MVIVAPRPIWLMKYAVPMRASSTMPIQNELKLPAVSPERMLSDGPPSREDVTTSWTWALSVDVKTLTSSGMIAPASVPQVMIAESFHHIVVSPPRLGMRTFDTANVTPTERIEVIQTSDVSGCSKLKWSAFLYLADAIALLIQYE